MLKRLPPMVVVAALSSGCSLLWVDGPPKVRPGGDIPHTAHCTTSSTMPVVDIIFGVTSVIMIAETLDGADEFTSGHVAMFAWPVGLFGSSIQGFRRMRACRDFLATPVRARPDSTGRPVPWSQPMSLGGRPLLLARPTQPAGTGARPAGVTLTEATAAPAPRAPATSRTTRPAPPG